MSGNESLSGQERGARHWKRLVLLVVPVIVIVVVLMVLQPWSTANQFKSDITKANAVMSDVESYRIFGSSAYDKLDGSMSQLSIEGEFTSPDRHYMEIMDNDEVSEFIIIGDILFVNNEQLFNPSSFAFMQYYRSVFDEEVLSNYLDLLIDIRKLPNEEIEGVSCIHYTGQWDVEKQMAVVRQGIIEARTSMGIEVDEDEIDMILEDAHSITMSTEFWISRDDYLVRQTKTNVQYPDYLEGFNISTTSATVTYYDFDEPIVIEAPVDIDGQLLSGWHIFDVYKSYTGY